MYVTQRGLSNRGTDGFDAHVRHVRYLTRLKCKMRVATLTPCAP